MRINPETGSQFASMLVQDEGEPLADLSQVSLNHSNITTLLAMKSRPNLIPSYLAEKYLLTIACSVS